MGSFVLPTLTTKLEIDKYLQNTLDKVLVLRFGTASDLTTTLLDDILHKSSRAISSFATIALVDATVDTYVSYFDITLFPSTVFFFNTEHMKINSGSEDHSKWVGGFECRQDFVDLVEVVFRGAMNGKVIVGCPIPPQRVPRFQLLFKGI